MLQRIKKYGASETSQRSVSTERPREIAASKSDLTSAVRTALDNAARARSDVSGSRLSAQVVSSSSYSTGATPPRDRRVGSSRALEMSPSVAHGSERRTLEPTPARPSRSKSASGSDRPAPAISAMNPSLRVPPPVSSPVPQMSAAIEDGGAVRKKVKATMRKNL